MWLLSVIYFVTGKSDKAKHVVLSWAIKVAFPPENPNKNLVETVKIIQPVSANTKTTLQLTAFWVPQWEGCWWSAQWRKCPCPRRCLTQPRVPTTGCLPGTSTSGKPALTPIRGHVIIQHDELQGLIKQSGKCTDFSANPPQLWFQQTRLPCQGRWWWLKVPSITWW